MRMYGQVMVIQSAILKNWLRPALIVAVSVLLGCATNESSGPMPFGSLIHVAPDTNEGMIFARTPIEGSLIQFAGEYLAAQRGRLENLRLVYLPRRELSDLSRTLVVAKGQDHLSMVYFSRHGDRGSDVAMLLFDEFGPATEATSRALVLRFDESRGVWQAQ